MLISMVMVVKVVCWLKWFVIRLEISVFINVIVVLMIWMVRMVGIVCVLCSDIYDRGNMVIRWNSV